MPSLRGWLDDIQMWKDSYEDLQPVIVIGMPQPKVVEAMLVKIINSFPVHLYSSFPASSSSVTDND